MVRFSHMLAGMFDDSDRRQGLPLLSLCPATAEPDISLTRRRIARVLTGAVVLCLLGIGHLTLRFAVKDIRLQHGRLQSDQRELLQSVRRLEVLNETLCAPDLLKQRAVEQLGMTETMDGAAEYVPLPVALRAKYLAPSTVPLHDSKHDDLDAHKPSSVERVAGVLTNVDRAMAGVETTD
jgi:hypothetical protein